LKIEEDVILTREQKNYNIMKKIPNKYKAHIAHEIDRQEYIDKRNGVRKKKTFALPVEITNLILSNVLNKLDAEKKRKSQMKKPENNKGPGLGLTIGQQILSLQERTKRR
jgi:mannitol-specific phosphotransferase system IIBC component